MRLHEQVYKVTEVARSTASCSGFSYVLYPVD